MLALRLLLLMLVAGAVVVGFVLASHHDGTGEIGVYACPMHPEVTTASPGSCPICGMALISMRVGDNTSSTPGSRPEPAEISIARLRLVNQQVRAPAWVDEEDDVVALLYNEDLAAIAPEEHGSFFSTAAPKTGTPVVRRKDVAPTAWDGATSTARFRLVDGARSRRRGDVGRLVLDPKAHEVLLVPAPAVLESPDGPYVLTGAAEGGAYTRQPISIGRTVAGFVVVQAGMEDKQRVVARDAFLLDAERRMHGP